MVMMILQFLFLSTLLFSPSYSTEIHHYMTKDERRKIFHTSQSAVPKYEVVAISHTMHKRSIDQSQVVRIKTPNKNVELYLNPSDGFLVGKNTPVWTVKPDRYSVEGLKYRQIKNPFDDIGQTYQDITTNTAVLMQKSSDGHINIYGKFNTDYVIQPVPRRLLNLFYRSSSRNNETEEEFNQSHNHIIFKRQDLSRDQIRRRARLIARTRTSSRISGKRLPDIIYPELLVIMDYSLYDVLGKNQQSAIMYLTSFWNAVDLRYRTMSNPQIRLNLAGFIISTRDGGTPYLDQHRRGEVEVDADGALNHMSQYFYRESRLPFKIYDMALALTNLDMCNLENNYCDTSTLGYAYEAGACNRSSIDSNTEAVGIVEDNGGYSAVLPATHEVAHLLGVPHDGTEDTFTCSGVEGFIMTGAVTFGQNSFFWSECSRKAFLDFFRSEDAVCLFNEPIKSAPLPRMLPGKIKTLDEQCYKVYGTRACYYDSRVCTRLECYIPRSNVTCNAVSAAAEGSECGYEMHCIRGNCIPKNAINIPDLQSTPEKWRWPSRDRFPFQPWSQQQIPSFPFR